MRPPTLISLLQHYQHVHAGDEGLFRALCDAEAEIGRLRAACGLVMPLLDRYLREEWSDDNDWKHAAGELRTALGDLSNG